MAQQKALGFDEEGLYIEVQPKEDVHEILYGEQAPSDFEGKVGDIYIKVEGV